jgi:hypothetical protein
MKPWFRIFVLYPVLIGVTGGALAVMLRGWKHDLLASFLLSVALINLLWLPFSAVPFLRRGKKRE